MARYPNIISAYDIARGDFNNAQAQINGRYVPARPLPLAPTWLRWKAVWLVLTGRADALVWPGQDSA